MTKLPHPVEAYITAYNAMDVDGMLAVLAEDVVFKNYSSATLTAEASDKAGFEELARLGVSAFKERRQTVQKAVTSGETTVLTIRYDAIVAMDLPNGWRAGQKLEFDGTSEFQVRGDKIVHITDRS